MTFERPPRLGGGLLRVPQAAPRSRGQAGALVLGVWGIRAILIPSNIQYITAVDLALSLVIIFVLGALTMRALVFVHDAAGLALLGRRRRPAGSSGSPGEDPERR